VRASLPPELAALSDLVMNLRWSWHQETLDLFASVDPELWRECGGDPVRLLGAVSPARLSALARDKRFLRRLSDAADDLADYLSQPRWYQEQTGVPSSIAYFSMEFGLTEVLPQYSGGLGILAGDHLKAASDLGVPIIGVGLLYRAGYFAQGLSRDGWQQELYPSIDPHGLPLSLVREADGSALRISLAVPGGRTLGAQVWKVQVGRVPLLLLDSDIEDNEAAERQVTDKLYGGTSEHRMAQEMLAGVGGVRAVRAYCRLTGTPAPEVFHTNEGHAGFLGLERMRELAADGLSFDEALAGVRAGTVFTTHTPVPAGIDRFAKDLVRSYYEQPEWAALPVERVLQLGAESDLGRFNMAHMGLRLAQRANGVSKLHGVVSREMFQPLWPGFDVEEVPITSVTNGVHAPTWMCRELLEIVDQNGADALLQEGSGWQALDKVPDEELWALRRTLRERLVDEVRRRVYASQLQRGFSDAELDWTGAVFDPDVLTVGFARRVPSYKRLTLMLRDPKRLKALLLHPERPIQIVVAGKSHPADDGGKSLIQQLVRFADDADVRHRIVFLPDYDIAMAHYLYWGCDVWLNNPLRPLEACGTSGMKAALNGGLNLSIRDGWWDEMYDGENGWAIPSASGVEDDRRDDIEAAGFYNLVETQVAPRFYDRRGEPPARWVEMVRHTLKGLGPQVLATRMVRDYVTGLYAPAAASSRTVSADGYAAAKRLAAWRIKVLGAWPAVTVRHVESTGVGDTPELGATLALRAEVDLAGLSPDDVDVQAAYGRVDETNGLHDVQTLPLAYAGDGDGLHRWDGTVPLERTGAFGYTVRVLPKNSLLATEAELGVVTVAS
jgi:glycogen phosphorylase